MHIHSCSFSQSAAGKGEFYSQGLSLSKQGLRGQHQSEPGLAPRLLIDLADRRELALFSDPSQCSHDKHLEHARLRGDHGQNTTGEVA